MSIILCEHGLSRREFTLNGEHKNGVVTSLPKTGVLVFPVFFNEGDSVLEQMGRYTMYERETVHI